MRILELLCLAPLAHLASATDADVVIIGAGAAGVSAATSLVSKGMSVVIIEAADYIGGRVKKGTMGNYTVELGANWIHGPFASKEGGKDNVVWRFKEKYGLEGAFTDYESGLFYERNGSAVGEEVTHRWWDKVEKAMEYCTEKSEKLWEKAEDREEYEDMMSPDYEKHDITLRECLEKAEYRKGVESQFDRDMANTMEWAKIDFEATHGPDTTSTMWELPMNPNYHEQDFLITDQRGYAYFLEQEAAGLDVRLNERVVEVDYSGRNRVRVTTASGLQVTGKHCISTVSLGVLQSDLIQWVPEFTAEKKDGIAAILMGNYAKVNLRFAENFWGDKETIMITGDPVGFMTWGISLDQSDYLPGSKVLSFHFAGELARRVEGEDQEQLVGEVMAELRRLFGEDAVEDPLEVVVTDFSTNPLFLGSYSDVPFGITSFQYYRMTDPVGRLHFAGEHTSESHFGFLHGAIKSGKRAANAVIDQKKSARTCAKYGKRRCKKREACAWLRPAAKCGLAEHVRVDPCVDFEEGQCRRWSKTCLWDTTLSQCGGLSE